MKVSCILCLATSLLGLAGFPSRAEVARQIVREHLPATARAHPIRERLPTDTIEFSIGLPLGNQQSLSNLLVELYDPSSPAYRRYLTPTQFAERFGPTKHDYQALTAWARSKGFAIRGTHPNRTLLDLEGAVSAIEDAFRVRMQVYRHPVESRNFYAPDRDLSIDCPVAILALSGLDDFVVPRPMDLKTSAMDVVPCVAPVATGSGPAGAFLGRDFRAAYAPGVELDGTGEAVGLFELDGYFANDVVTYLNLAGLPQVPRTDVLVNGFTGRPGPNNIEVALDIDMAIAMAPGLSRVIVYEGGAASANAVLNRMATDNFARQLSCSWSFGLQVDPIRQQIFQQYAAQGQSFFQASGDDGAWNGPVLPPSDDPWVTVVGGTSLQTAGPGGAWVGETAWSGSGGGVSTVYNLPSWQKGVGTPANQGSATKRNVPDVAAQADVTIWLVANNGQQGRVGGASAAAPLWAGFAALANQQAQANGAPPIGFINPALYAIGAGSGYAAALHDITVGNNTNTSSPTRFFAVRAFDLCTGWGTPTGSNSIGALLAPADALRISPSAAAAFTGPAGGPFLPVLQTYVLTNFGSRSLDWALGSVPEWLNAWSSGGTLIPGGPTQTLRLGLTPAANALPAGFYGATLWFTNLNNNYVQNRSVTLSVVTPPQIVLPPANQAVFEGATATFSVGTAANAFLSYQWYFDNGAFRKNLFDGGDVSGSETDTLVIRNVTSTNVGAYSVLVSNSVGAVTSSNAFLTIIPWRPVIISAPGALTALPGSDVAWSVSAVGAQPLRYQWLRNGVALTNGGNIAGATSPTLVITNVSSADAAQYSVQVNNTLGKVTTAEVPLNVLTVTAPGTTITTLYAFTGGADGAYPNGLTQATNGAMYGTTQMGGADASGTMFQLSPAGAIVTLHSFQRDSDGANPRAPLTVAPDGMLYGTTYLAGSNGFGTIFRATAKGQLSTLFSFDLPGGILPCSGVTPARDGSLYGTTYEGGSGVLTGTIYRWGRDGTAVTLHSFSGGSDGALPYAGLVPGSSGDLYGTTYAGGDNRRGTIYRIGTNGLFATVIAFNQVNGASPSAGLVLCTDGNFYGATLSGGVGNNGVLFRVDTEGFLTLLHEFSGGVDGANPAATLVEAADGNLYGTTASGGTYGKGTVFRLSPTGNFANLVQFDGFNGARPYAPLAEGADGSLYGGTRNGGPKDQGILFRLASTSAPEITGQPANQSVFVGTTVRLSVSVAGSPPLYYRWFKEGTNLTDGVNVAGASARVLVLKNVTVADAGTFAVTVSNTLGSKRSLDALLQVASSKPVIALQPNRQTVVPGATVSFGVKAEGNQPLYFAWQKDRTNLVNSSHISGADTSILSLMSVTEADNGKYSVTVSNLLGSTPSDDAELEVIPLSAPGTRMKTLHWFTGGTNGSHPNGLAQAADGCLYGTTQSGGPELAGILVRVPTNGVVSPVATFSSTHGVQPQGALTAAPGGLVGTAQYGGLYGEGTVFRIGTNLMLSNVYSFSGATDGGEPKTGLTLGADGNFYGSTTTGGAAGYGDLFRLTPGGTCVTLYNFTNGVDGGSPTGPLLRANDGNFYGMTPHGGTSAYGSVFRLSPAGDFANLYSFRGGTDGYLPAGALIQAADGQLYGVTTSNRMAGYEFYGTIFQLTTNGSLTTFYPLNYGDGSYPAAGLVQAGDGNFYGTTYHGGNYDLGTVYRLTSAGAFGTLVSFDGPGVGAHPASALVAATDGALYGTATEGGRDDHGTVFKLSLAPVVLAMPASRQIFAGTDVTLTASVFGTLPLAFQWRQNGTNLVDGGNISGSGTASLHLGGVSFDNGGIYSLLVTNSVGTVSSNGPLVSVISPPVFHQARRTNDLILLSWTAATGYSYQLQTRTQLTSGAWTTLGSPILATNCLITVSDPIGANGLRFYRVQVLDPGL